MTFRSFGFRCDLLLEAAFISVFSSVLQEDEFKINPPTSCFQGLVCGHSIMKGRGGPGAKTVIVWGDRLETRGQRYLPFKHVSNFQIQQAGKQTAKIARPRDCIRQTPRPSPLLARDKQQKNSESSSCRSEPRSRSVTV